MKRFVFTLLSLITLLVIFNATVQAQSSDELSKELLQKQEEIAKLESQLGEARKQEKTLKSQLDIIDGQAKVTQLKIEQTQLQIAKLDREIEDLSGRITRISSSVDTLSEILLNRIVQTYKYSSITTIDLLFSSHGFADLVERLKYIQVAQTNDKKVLYQLQATKAAYKDQRQDKETRQAEAERLTKELEAYKSQLAEQRKAKDELLRITRNDEARFQGLINKLKADLASIAQAISNVGPPIKDVSRGEFIGIVGSSGCSTGPHLHYEVFKNAKIEGKNIIGERVDPKPFIDNGQFDKPIKSYNGNLCTKPEDQCFPGYISTLYGQIYFLGEHTGLDIVENFGASIHASDQGTAYALSAPCSRSIPGGTSIGRGIAIDHKNGYVTLYWHIP